MDDRLECVYKDNDAECMRLLTGASCPCEQRVEEEEMRLTLKGRMRLWWAMHKIRFRKSKTYTSETMDEFFKELYE